jgi:hypothetical protein
MTDDEVTVQIKVPPDLKRELQKKAFARDETMKTFILRALRKAGLRVPQALLEDKRKNRGK